MSQPPEDASRPGRLEPVEACSAESSRSPDPRPAPPPWSSPAVSGRIGIIAGGGDFPLYVARRAREQGLKVFCVGLRHSAPPELAAVCDGFRMLGMGRLNATVGFFRRHGVRELTMAGWIRKEGLFRPWRLFSLLPDWRLLRLWYFKVRNRQDATLLAAVAEEFESEGMEVTHSTKYCPELLADEGVYTRKSPSRSQWNDVRFGWSIAKRMADLDVGQSVVVCERSTLAVEGIEGTDRNIRRAGELHRRGGFTVVKVAKADHDMRFDVPTIGPGTIETLHEAGGAVLAIEAGRTMVLDRQKVIQLADRWGIVIVSLREPPPEDEANST